MPNYTYNGQPISEQAIFNAAQALGMSVEDYLEEYDGFEVVDTPSDSLLIVKPQGSQYNQSQYKPIVPEVDLSFEAQTGIKKENPSIWEIPGKGWQNRFIDWWKISEDETQEDATWIEDWFSPGDNDKNQLTNLIGDQWRSLKRGWHGAEDIDDFAETYGVESASDLTDTQMSNIFKAIEERSKVGMSDEMLKFMRKTNNKDNSKTFNWLDALTDGTIVENPGVILDVALSTFSGMASALATSSETRKTTAKTVGGGIVGGAAIGGAVAAVPGAIAWGIRGGLGGLFAGINGSIETASTFGDQLRKEVDAAGLEWNEENAKKVLQDQEAFKRIKNKSIVKGSTVAGIDMIANTLIPGVGSSVLRKGVVGGIGRGSKRVAAATVMGAEGLSGAFGEFASSKAIGEDSDSKELWLEFFGEFGASGPTNVYQALKNPPSYKIRGKKASGKDIIDFLDDPNITDEEKANVDIEIKNHPALEERVSNIKRKAYIKSTVDPTINKQEDIDKTVELELELLKHEGNTSHSGKMKAKDIKKKINEIRDKYADVDRRTKEVKDKQAIKTRVEQKARSIKLKKTKNFAKVVSEQMNWRPFQSFKNTKDYIAAAVGAQMSGMDLTARFLTEKLGLKEGSKEFNNQYKKLSKENEVKFDTWLEGEANILADQAMDSDGVTITRAADGSKGIIINEEIAGKKKALGDVGSHEVLHGVLKNALAGMKKPQRRKLIKDFKLQVEKNLGAKVVQAIEKRLNDNYADFIKKDADWINTTDEWFTALSDIIEEPTNNITYDNNKGFFNNIKDKVANIFNKETPYKKLSIETGEDAFNFMKEYSKNVKAGKLSESMLEFAKTGKAVPVEEDTADFSKSNMQGVLEEYGGEKATKPDLRRMVNETLMKTPQGQETFDITKSRFGQEVEPIVEAITKRLYDKIPSDATRAAGLTRDDYKNALVSEAATMTQQEYDPTTQDLDKFISNRLNLRAESLAKRLGVQEKILKDVDFVKETDIDIDEKPETKKKPKIEPKTREIKKLSTTIYGIANSIGLNSRIQSIISEDAKNLEQNLKTFISKELTKQIKKQMGKIQNIKGEVVVSEEYKAFLGFNYENIVQGFDVETIKNNYKTLFDLTEIGKEDKVTRKADKPGLKKDSYYRKSIFKISTNKAKFTKFFTEGGYTTLLDRQKKLANIIAESMTEDIVNDQIIENSDNVDAIVDAKLRDFASSLNRQKKEVRGNYADQVQFSRKKLKDALYLRDEIKSGKNVFKNGKLTNAYKNIDNVVGNFVYNELYKDGLIRDVSDIKYLQKTFKNFVKAGKRGTAYEQALIDQAIAYEKKYGKELVDVILRKPTEVGGKPDMIVKLFGTEFNIEAKMTNAQYSSVTFAVDENGNFSIKKDYSFNDQILPLGKQVQKGIKAAKARLKKEGYEWDNIKVIPTDLYNILKKEPVTIDGVEYSSYINAMSAEMDISLDVVSEIYNKKKDYPVNLIQLMGRGLFYMGGFNDMDNILGLPPLKGNAKIMLRVGSNSQYKTVNGVRSKTGNKVLTFRAIPTIPKETLNKLQSPHSIGTVAGIDALVKSKQAENLQLSRSAKNNKTLSDAVQFSRSSKNPTKGITVLDFDDTLATTKSGVRAKIPNLDGTPKPGRKVIFLAGGAGSGKSNVVKQLGLEDQGFKVVNQDISLEWLKKNSGLPADMRDLTKEQKSTLGKLQAEARKIAKRKMMKFKGEGNGVVVDGTGGSIKAMEKLVNEFKDKGYDVSMLFVDTSLEVALERNKARKERSLLDKIVERNHAAVQDNKDGFKKMFGNRFMEVNTDNLKQEDPMPNKLVNQMGDFVSGYENRRLDAEEFALEGADILEQGGTFDFSEFNKVVEGQTAPLFNKALKLQDKFGNKDMYVLTARPSESQQAIFDFLKANGLNIPLENITGLANSTPEAKALWMADKVGEGYNDFYFADDALQNVQAVQNMLDQFDVKSKVQQAKAQFSKSMNSDFNNILEESKGIGADKIFSDVKAKKRGAKKGRFAFFLPPSAEDFTGLLYAFLGKGKQGEAHFNFFKKALINPLNRAYRELNSAKQNIANNYKALKKQYPNAVKKLTKDTPDGDFSYSDAVRVYLWDKAGFDIPGLTKSDKAELVDLIKNDEDLKSFADTLGLVSKQKEGYVEPGDNWLTEDIRNDLDNATGKIGRKKFFKEFLENAEVIFSKENLNKIEAIYGSNFREALEDILYRIENGTNRSFGKNRLVNTFMNYVNGSIGATMFFNARSAVLQTLSTVNFINWGDNNIFKAAKAFANQDQYWKDFSRIFNSDMLKQRRSGLKQDINAAELTRHISKSKEPMRAAVNWLLQKGFLPTQMMDSFAIAAGGATFLRNRIDTYVKQGMKQKEAESKAFIDFQEIAEATQQSARPDMISQQQASPLGRLILAFQNTPMQYMRLAKKSMLDLVNGRGDAKTHVSRIIYYGAVQNLIFYSLQSALFAMMFGLEDKEDEEEFFKKKKDRVANSMLDGILRGIGVGGAVVSTVKNMAIKFAQEQDKSWNSDEYAVLMEMLNVSPPIGIKARKLTSATKTYKYNKKVIDEMETFDIDNPVWDAVGNVVESTTNVPLARLHRKTMNIREALNQENEAWQRIALALGWSRWDVGVSNKEIEDIKKKIKKNKKKSKKKNRVIILH